VLREKAIESKKKRKKESKKQKTQLKGEGGDLPYSTCSLYC